MAVSEPKGSIDFNSSSQQTFLPPTRRMSSQSVGTQTRATDFSTSFLKSFMKIFSRTKQRYSVSTHEPMPDSFKKRKTQAQTKTVSTETEATEKSKIGDFCKHFERIFSFKASRRPKEKTHSKKEMEHEPTTVYECCLDVSCVEPPPIIPMDYFTRRRSSKGGIPMTATKSDLESATLLSFTMDNK